MKNLFTKNLLLFILSLGIIQGVWGQTPVPMASQTNLTYTENFSDISNWTPNFAGGTGANRWASYPITTGGTANDGKRTTKSSVTFSTTTSGGIQKGTGNLVFLSTGSSATSEAVAVDLLLDFTGVNAGTISLNWAGVANSGTRPTSLRIYWSIDNINFTELTSGQMIDVLTNSGAINQLALPSDFNNSSTAKLRFYNHAGSISGTGNRNKISIDDLSITALSITAPCTPPTTQATAFITNNITSTSADITYTRGNGDNVLVIAKIGSAETTLPTSGTAYATNDAIGTTGAFVAYNGSAANFSMASLTSLSTYHLTFYEYATTNICYNTTSPLTGSFTTLDIAPIITNASYAGTVGTTFSETITNTGGAATSYAVTTGNLPAGLTLNATTGEISGTPTTVEMQTVTITATNATGSDVADYTITITAPLAIPILVDQAFNGITGTAFTQTLTNTGGTATFALTTGTLPAGLTLNTATGEISGTPTTVETQIVTITATNTGGSDNADYTININAPVLAPVLTNENYTGTVGTAFSETITNTGSAATFAVTTGTLPAGLTLDAATGTISGTPTTVEMQTVTITATNATGSDVADYTITITAPLAIPVLADQVFNGITGTAFTQTLTNTGGTATFALTTGTLPAGLTLNTATGEISGTPTTVETQIVTITATNTGGSDNADYTINITAPVLAPVLTNENYTGTVGTAFSETITNTGSAATFAVTTGTLPAGLTLNTTTGTISGTPTAVETQIVTITATNATGSDVADYTFTITSPLAIPILVDQTFNGITGTAFTQTLTNTGGTATFALTTGTLPAGLTLNTATGEISGTPTTVETQIVTITATNTGGSDNADYTINITAPVLAPVLTNENYTGTVGTAFSETITNTGSAATFAVTTGTLPAGLTLNTNTGTISGTPSTVETQIVTITATNTTDSDVADYTITIQDIPTSSTCFSEDFSHISQGNNTTSTGSSNSWSGNSTWTAAAAYQAGGAVKLGTGSLIGSITNSSFVASSSHVTLSFDVKGWSTVEGPIKVTLGTQTQNFSYTALMAGNFETKTFDFTNVPVNTPITLKLETTAKRAFLDNISVTCYPVSCAAPTTQATNFASTNISATSADITFTRGNGDNVLVIAKPGSVSTAAPTSGTTYVVNDAIGTDGSYVAYIGTAANFTVATLTAATTYHLAFYEFNSTDVCYNTTTPLTGSFTTLDVAPILSDATYNGTVGTAFSETITNTGGLATTFGVTAGTLPAGLTLDPATGVIDGNPTIDGTTTVTITATNAIGNSEAEYTFIISPLVIDAPVLTGTTYTGTVGTVFTQTITNTGDAATFAVTTGTLPAGLTLDPATGEISGTPTTVESQTVTITATNGGGTVQADYTITINDIPASTTCFSEDFAFLTDGGHTTTTGATGPTGSNWSGNTTWTATSVYPAGGAVKLGTGSAIGSLTNQAFVASSSHVTLSFDVKGWTTVEGPIKVTLGTQTQNATYTAVVSGNFETKTIDFTNVPVNTPITLKLETTTKRAFLDNISVTCYPVVCTEPTTQASNFAATNITTTSADITYTRGNGDNVLVIAKAGSVSTATPTSGTAYSVNDLIGTDGSYVAYNGTAANFALATLTGSTTYHLAFYEYNSTDDCYNTTAPLTGTFATLDVAPILTAQLYNGIVGTAFSETIVNTGGNATSYAITAGTLPAGLTFNTTTGEISGMPTTVETQIVTIEATNSAGSSNALYKIVIEDAPVSNFCFEEDFAEILEGNSASSSGSATAWDGGSNWTVDRAYQAGGAVKLGTGSAVGSILTTFTPSSNEVEISIDVKGWSSIEGDLIVTLGTQSNTVSYTAVMSSNYETVTTNFTNVVIGQATELTIATSAKRAFVDNVTATCAPTCVTTSSITKTECTSYTAPDGQVYTTSGVKTATLINANVNGCDSIVSINLTITGNPVITNVINATETDASINVSVTGGTAPYVYQWSNGTFTEDLASVQNGTYTITVQDANNCTANATIVVSTVSVQTIEGINTKIYPNPSTGQFTIAFNNNLNGEVTMTDLSGKIIYNATFSGTTIPMDVTVEKGIYLVTVATPQGTIVERVSIQ